MATMKLYTLDDEMGGLHFGPVGTPRRDACEARPKESQPAAPRLTLRKGERLHHTPLVQRLFANGVSTYAYPLRMFHLRVGARQMQEMFHGRIPRELGPLQVMVIVPKKKFRHAVDRVWLRRRIREAYRLGRLPLKEAFTRYCPGDFLLLAFIYVDSQRREYASIERKMDKLLSRLSCTLCPATQTPDNDEQAAQHAGPTA